MNASEMIDHRISELADWRGKIMAQARKIIRETEPNIVEEWKWDTPVWSLNGNVVSAGGFQDHVKLNFFKGASVEDPQHLFNVGLEAKATRAIDIYEGDQLNEAALKDLIRSAVALNRSKVKAAKKPKAAKGE